MDVSENSGFPPQIIHKKIGFSIINHPFWGPTPIFGKHPYVKAGISPSKTRLLTRTHVIKCGYGYEIAPQWIAWLQSLRVFQVCDATLFKIFSCCKRDIPHPSSSEYFCDFYILDGYIIQLIVSCNSFLHRGSQESKPPGPKPTN